MEATDVTQRERKQRSTGTIVALSVLGTLAAQFLLLVVAALLLDDGQGGRANAKPQGPEPADVAAAHPPQTAAERERRITQEGFGPDWPLTISEAIVGCRPPGQAYARYQGTEYGIYGIGDLPEDERARYASILDLSKPDLERYARQRNELQNLIDSGELDDEPEVKAAVVQEYISMESRSEAPMMRMRPLIDWAREFCGDPEP